MFSKLLMTLKAEPTRDTRVRSKKKGTRNASEAGKEESSKKFFHFVCIIVETIHAGAQCLLRGGCGESISNVEKCLYYIYLALPI